LAGFLNPDRQSENQERLEALGAGSGAADVEYEQFLKAKEAGVDFCAKPLSVWCSLHGRDGSRKSC
jgi:hypothetical protein